MRNSARNVICISQLLAFYICWNSLSFAQIRNDDGLIWKKENKLNWSYYLGSPKIRSEHAAISFCQLDFVPTIINDTLKCRIVARLIKSKSWVNPKFMSETGLNHEQGHFDIEEIYARLFRKKISEFKFSKNNYKKNLDILYNSIGEELNNKHQEYDIETNFSNDTLKQYEWTRKIAIQLDKLKDFEHPEVFTIMKINSEEVLSPLRSYTKRTIKIYFLF